MAVTRIAEIPFVERDVLELLALEHERLAVDADYAGFGWATAPRVVLDAPDRRPIELRDAVVIALHSADEQPGGDDIELLFELPDQSVMVPLSRFLPHALASVPSGRPVVLALCNPKDVEPRDVSTPIHHAFGDVTSWLDRDADGSSSIRLSARRWRLAGAPP